MYKLSIDQGNIITQDMVDKLQPGMTRSQVQFVMGSPLIADPFHEDRWDYIYTLLDSKGKRTEQHLTVFFTDDKLSSLSGNVVPQGDASGPVAAPETATPPTGAPTAEGATAPAPETSAPGAPGSGMPTP